mmetsp:Transcript_19157/g.73314  ORF Transcript_19157/g.73314 Transcript_19157/m.73314 type:complete len:208 (+) Transcript_19157:362-985(+)
MRRRRLPTVRPTRRRRRLTRRWSDSASKPSPQRWRGLTPRRLCRPGQTSLAALLTPSPASGRAVSAPGSCCHTTPRTRAPGRSPCRRRPPPGCLARRRTARPQRTTAAPPWCPPGPRAPSTRNRCSASWPSARPTRGQLWRCRAGWDPTGPTPATSWGSCWAGPSSGSGGPTRRFPALEGCFWSLTPPKPRCGSLTASPAGRSTVAS